MVVPFTGSRKLKQGQSACHAFAVVFLTKNCSRINEFHSSPELSLTKVYLFEDKLTVRVAIHSSRMCWELGPNPAEKEGQACFSSALKVHESMPKVGQYLFIFY